jgi:hypothetical protein
MEMLDLIAYRKSKSPELGPGILFSTGRLVVDAFYTSKVGIKGCRVHGQQSTRQVQNPGGGNDLHWGTSPVII